MRNVSLYNRLNSLCRCVALPNWRRKVTKSGKHWLCCSSFWHLLGCICLFVPLSLADVVKIQPSKSLNIMSHTCLFQRTASILLFCHFPSQAKGKRQAGLREGEEPQRGPSEEGGGLFRPQREAGWLQEADAAGPEGGAVSVCRSLLTADTVYCSTSAASSRVITVLYFLIWFIWFRFLNWV